MPIYERIDKKGHYYQYGNHGSRYYFNSKTSRSTAYKKAVKQAAAVHASGWK